MSLRPYQQEAVDRCLEFLAQPTGNPLIVAPTGSGKSHILAEIIRERYKAIPNYRCVVLSHRKEILSQNAQKLLSCWPEAPLGVFSAGLRSRRIHKITIAGIQSIYDKAERFGLVHDVIVDEVHLVPKKGQGMYLRFLKEIRRKNPEVRLIGLTATPYRLDSGLLTSGESALFDAIAYDIKIKPLVEKGFLARLVSKNSKNQADLSGLRLVGGDYVQKEAAQRLNVSPLTKAAVAEMCALGQDRKAWLVFCAGVEHVQAVVQEMKANGINAVGVTGETPIDERDRILKDFKAGKIRCVCNCEVLTIGFDAPNLDLLALLRATQSTALYVQMVGRGMRPFPGKENCLLLDYAGNLETHGPIDLISISNKSGNRECVERAPIRTCPKCREACPITAKECLECGFIFPEPEQSREVKHAREASTAPAMAAFAPPQTYAVNFQTCKKHFSRRATDKPPTLQIVYNVGAMREFSEYLCFEHQHPFPRSKARDTWRKLGGEEPIPETIDEALIRFGELRKVQAITVSLREEFPRIIRRILASKEQQEAHNEARAEMERIGIL